MTPLRRMLTTFFLMFAALLFLSQSTTVAAHPVPGEDWYSRYGDWVRSWFPPGASRPGPSSILRDSAPLISLSLRYRGDLKLTLDQVEQLETLRDSFSRRYRRDSEEIRNMNEDLRKSLRKAPLNLADAERRIRAIEKKRSDLRLARLQAIEKGRAVLNSDQQKRLTEIMKETNYPARRYPPRGGWFMPGPPMPYGPWWQHHEGGERHHHPEHHTEEAPKTQKKNF